MQNSPGRPGIGQSGGSHTNGLEDHLRNLILTNGTPGTGPTHFPDASRTTAPLSGGGSMNGPDVLHSQDPSDASIPLNGKPPASPKVARKRPNQAQRRQMNAQLSIPIDPRPSPPTQHGRPFSGSPNYPSHNPGFHGNRGRHHHPTGPHHGPGHTVGPYSGGQPHSPRQNGHHYPTHSDTSRNHHDQHFNGRQDNGAPRYPRNPNGTLYSPRSQYHQIRPEELENQAAYLEGLCSTLVVGAEIERGEIAEKEAFRIKIEQVCRAAITEYEVTRNGLGNFPSPSVQLKCFGSLSSGFATKASDMDLGLVSPLSLPQPDAAGSPIPRLVEKAFLDLGLGARLLTRTRVPIIKLCEKPPEKLRLDLLEEREKWEKGIVDTEHADVVDEDENPEMESHIKEGTEESTDDPASQKVDSSSLAGSANESRLPTIRQPENQSLSAYYNVAKRTLRRVGGRDVTLSNCRELTEEDYDILNKVCEAFFNGLRDPELKRRLSNYHSLSFKPLPNVPNYRSLAGVYAQMEGERIVMLCETDAAIGSAEDADESTRMLIASWKALQNQPHFGIEPLTYTKQLQLHLEKLKKLPTAQLLTLEQSQHEAATGYHARILKILSNLRPRNNSDADAARQIIIDKYTAGIWPSTVRAQVREFVDNTKGPLSLVAVARRHKSLQLALELEKAVEHQLYDPSLESDIREYISILRGPMRESKVQDPQYDHVIPVTKQNIETIKRMRDLKDPAKMTVNQPRDPYKDKLEFPKNGVGVQCDINFAAHLALHNTLLLRCYSHTDPRVRPLVLFIKHWAKVRGINTPYRGTLSSYGYVLMMLHYLVNVVQPFVCPNLQALGPPPPPEGMSPTGVDESIMCRGHFVGFWRDEAEILRLAQMNQLNGNRDSLGQLLRGFFEYYAQNGSMSTYSGRGYDWGRDVLSIRTPGGLLSKTDKGWTGAKTVIEYRPNAAVNSPSTDTPSTPRMALKSSVDPPTPTAITDSAITQGVASPGLGKAATTTATANKNGEVKEVRHRYLFAIEDPFELDHNVARTVTHNGIVAIRDEFRRAWRIIKAAGTGNFSEELLQDVATIKEEGEKSTYLQLLDEIHGWELFE
ncbi:poly RNA polymerase cid13 [Colletotrichum incanum]|nr:poly RNA polymerase cid13 [Colletotrichum incanum]